jgi:bilin biosynthesis protein
VAALTTRTTEISHASTDALVESVRVLLNAGSVAGQGVLQDMVVHLADSRGMARLKLVEAFGRVGSAAVPVLLTGLTDCPNPVVRRSCGKALAKIGDPAATETLIETLINDEDTVTRSSSAGALARMGLPAVPALLAVISSPDTNMTTKGHAAWAISFMQGEAGDALFARANDPNPNVRLAVVSALGAVAIGDALPSMGSIASSGGDWEAVDLDGDDDVAFSAASAQRARAVKIMALALDDACAEVRAEATTALANAGVVTQAPRIMALLQHPDMELRRTAALALMKLGHVDAIDALRERAADESELDSVRNVANLAANSLVRASNTNSEDDDAATGR